MAKSTRTQARQRVTTSNVKNWAKEWLDAIIWAGTVALIVRTFFFEAYRIPTPSMERTVLTDTSLRNAMRHAGRPLASSRNTDCSATENDRGLGPRPGKVCPEGPLAPTS